MKKGKKESKSKKIKKAKEESGNKKNSNKDIKIGRVKFYKDETPDGKEEVQERARLLYLSIDAFGQRKYKNFGELTDEIIRWRNYNESEKRKLYMNLRNWKEKFQWEETYKKVQMAGLEKVAIEEGEIDVISKLTDDHSYVYKSALERHKLAQIILIGKLKGFDTIKDENGDVIQFDTEVPYNALTAILKDAEATLLKMLGIDKKDDPVVNMEKLINELPEEILDTFYNNMVNSAKKNQ